MDARCRSLRKFIRHNVYAAQTSGGNLALLRPKVDSDEWHSLLAVGDGWENGVVIKARLLFCCAVGIAQKFRVDSNLNRMVAATEVLI